MNEAKQVSEQFKLLGREDELGLFLPIITTIRTEYLLEKKNHDIFFFRNWDPSLYMNLALKFYRPCIIDTITGFASNPAKITILS